MNLYASRAINTKVCVDLAFAAFEIIDCGLQFLRCKQSKRGKYYSAMPEVLKDICVKNFTRLKQAL
jgi:hypothetical protein